MEEINFTTAGQWPDKSTGLRQWVLRVSCPRSSGTVDGPRTSIFWAVHFENGYGRRTLKTSHERTCPRTEVDEFRPWMQVLAMFPQRRTEPSEASRQKTGVF